MAWKKWAAAASLLALAACDTDGNVDFGLEEVVITCPEARLIPEASSITRFQDDAGRDVTDILYEGEFVGLGGECILEDNIVSVELTTGLALVRGAALKSNRADSEIIMAVADRDRKILSQRRFPITLAFSKNAISSQYTETFQIQIPMAEGRMPEDYLIFMGFGLSRSELKANRDELGL